MHATTVLVTGATGYIGGRLVPRLLAAGYRVRCLVRSADKLRARPWGAAPGVEIVEGDAGDESALAAAMTGCDAGFYLVHSMMVAGGAYAERDARLADLFGRAAGAAGLGRIVYLGGLGETGASLSAHLASRRQVEDGLRAGGVPVTVLRAAMIIGSGSASFEILRYLVERLPVMVTPRWVDTPCQPIAVRNVLSYLVDCLRVPETAGRTLDIGGAEVRTYRELMQELAAALGLKPRLILPVPVLTPRLSSLWIHLVTPVPSSIARPLTEGLRNPVVCRDGTVRALMPQRLLTVRESFDTALASAAANRVESAWSDAGPIPGDPHWAGGARFEDRRTTVVRAPAAEVFAAVCRIGGRNGWYGGRRLWWLRGVMDRVVGGPGLGRGRRDDNLLRCGDAVDCWRVRTVDAGERVVLRAEMRLPGEAELELVVRRVDESTTELEQVARFAPRGLGGLLYWAAVTPFHAIVFRGMLEGIRRAAESREAALAAAGR